MTPHPVHALDPVFEYLDGLIRDHGDTLFMVVCYAAIPLCVWILFGGSRRKSRHGNVPPVIVIRLPTEPPPPPSDEFHPFPPYQEPPDCDHDDYYRD